HRVRQECRSVLIDNMSTFYPSSSQRMQVVLSLRSLLESENTGRRSRTQSSSNLKQASKQSAQQSALASALVEYRRQEAIKVLETLELSLQNQYKGGDG